eukprot:3372121-Pleurochrysis_carterae.AAC.1
MPPVPCMLLRLSALLCCVDRGRAAGCCFGAAWRQLWCRGGAVAAAAAVFVAGARMPLLYMPCSLQRASPFGSPRRRQPLLL